MRIIVIEPRNLVDTVTLRALSARHPHVRIDLFGEVPQALAAPPSQERALLCVSQFLLAGEHLPGLRQLQARLPNATLVLIRRTADLLDLRALLDALPELDEADEARPGARLSERETEIVLMMRRGLQNKHIARALDLSLATVKTHAANIYRKLGASNRLDAICRYAGTAAPPTRPLAPERFVLPRTAAMFLHDAA